MEIKFEERAVAFIDVLGFSSLVKSAANEPTSFNKLQTLVDLLASAVPEFNQVVSSNVPAHLIPEHTYISDSIILSAPLRDDSMKSYSGLSTIVMRCIQLTHHFLKAGYLLRGGISTGKVWHHKSNIVGPAYQDAHALDCKGSPPRIVLSESAKAMWKFPDYGTRMCVKDGDIVMVNGLHDYYILGNTKRGVIENAFDGYQQLATLRIDSEMPDDAKAKWQWFKKYLSSERTEALKWAEAYSAD